VFSGRNHAFTLYVGRIFAKPHKTANCKKLIAFVQTMPTPYQTINQTINQTMSNEQKRRGRKPKHTPEKIKTQLDTNQMTTFHFNFSDPAVELLSYFATKHRYDERKIFKENWEKWIKETEVDECISAETRRLSEEGYSGDVVSKMFKSVRYYYRKKPMTPKEPKQRKPYVALPADILAKMDNHIIEVIVANTNPETKQCIISPAKAYEAYLKKEAEAKQNADEQAQQAQMDDADKDKYKKTYKNRFFIATQNVRAIA